MKHYWVILNYVWAILALMLGSIIYLIFRTENLLIFEWIPLQYLQHWSDALQEDFWFHSLWLPDWVIYSLPNGLWAFSYSLIITTLWIRRISRLKYLWLLSIPLLVFGFEFMQLLKIIPGTFCLADLLWGGIGMFLGFIIGINSLKYNFPYNFTRK